MSSALETKATKQGTASPWVAIAAVLALAAMAALALVATPAMGQKGGGLGSTSKVTVQSISSPAPNLGNVVSANHGDTIFTISASDGSVSRSSGGGHRLSTGVTQVLVTIACDTGCNQNVYVQVGSLGDATGRAGHVTNFTVQPVTAVLVASPSGTDPMTFQIGPIGNGSTKTFYLGMNLPIAGDDSGRATGPASSGFYVGAAAANQTDRYDVKTGVATATVFRPLSLSISRNLSFGHIVKPRTGSGRVTLDPEGDALTLEGVGTVVLNDSVPRTAAYNVSGEGGQTFSISMPATFSMTGPGGNSLTVTTSTNADASPTLTSVLGSAGTYGFSVGGSFPISSTTVTGTYSGSFTVTVNYN